jgi:hypothetical protein
VDLPAEEVIQICYQGITAKMANISHQVLEVEAVEGPEEALMTEKCKEAASEVEAIEATSEAEAIGATTEAEAIEATTEGEVITEAEAREAPTEGEVEEQKWRKRRSPQRCTRDLVEVTQT